MKGFQYIIFSSILTIILGIENSEYQVRNGSIYGLTTQWSIGSYIHTKNVSLQFQLEIISPTKPGTYPVVFFMTGLDGLVPSLFYSDFNTRFVTTTNRIIINVDKLSAIHLPNKEENLFEITLNWAIDNMKNLFNAPETPDFIKNQVFPDTGPRGYTLLSHSSAAHPVCLYMYKHCGLIKKLVLMDPVDGFDPFGIVKSYVTNPPTPLPFKMPTLIISTGLDPIPVIEGLSACAPTNISNTRFYECLVGPTFYLNFTNYGHADVLDEFIRHYFADLVCKSCEKNTPSYTCDFDAYRQNLVDAIYYFLDGIDNGNSTFINALENPNKSGLFAPNMNILSTYDLHGFDIYETGPFCNHD